MRPVVRGDCPLDATGNEVAYKEYGHTRGALIERLGAYCSYCEMKIPSALAVEHCLPKKPKSATTIIQARLLDWHNFLLACTNCNSTKSDEDIAIDDYVWPDRHNTFLTLIYADTGEVKAAAGLHQAQAQLMIELVGLDVNPSKQELDKAASDRRWAGRLETWGKAKRAKANLKKVDLPEMREQIVDTAEDGWSIWMTVFKDDSDMLQRFIQKFAGTAANCFDAANGFAAIARP